MTSGPLTPDPQAPIPNQGPAAASPAHPNQDSSDLDSADSAPTPFLQWLGLAFFQTFAKGLIAILPVGAAIVLMVWFYSAFEGFFGSAIQNVMRIVVTFFYTGPAETAPNYYRPGMGFLLGMVLIFLLGLSVNALIVRQLLAASESLLQRLPLAKTVMSSVRDVTGFFTKSEKKQMNQVVLVLNINTGFKMVGFVTRQDLSDLPEPMGDPAFVAVFFPLSYAMGGYTMLVPRTLVQPVDMTMEDAMRFALTAGMKSDVTKTLPVGAARK